MRHLALLALLSLAACSGGKPAPLSPDVVAMGPGTYAYLATSEAGAPLVVGTLTLDPTLGPGNEINGSWDFHWYPAADTMAEVGPQIGTGFFRGMPHGDSVTIELNPQNADNNAGLIGEWDGSKLVGTWDWVTITGVRTTGRFVLSKNG